MAIHHLSVDDDTAADTCAQSNHDEIFHTTCSAVGHFADGSRIGIVGQSRRNTQPLLKHGCQRNNALPRQVRSKFYRTAIIVAVGRADADALDFIRAAVGDNERQQVLTYSIHVIIYFRICAGLDRTACNDCTTCVYYSKYGVCATNVYAHYVGLFHVRVHDMRLF